MPLEPTISTVSTSPNSRKSEIIKNVRTKGEKKNRDETKDLKIYSEEHTFPRFNLSLERLVLPHHCRLVIHFVTKQIVTHLTKECCAVDNKQFVRTVIFLKLLAALHIFPVVAMSNIFSFNKLGQLLSISLVFLLY